MEEKIPACFAAAELEQLLKNKTAQLQLIDVRSAEEFAEKHIPGAIHIPLDELETRSGKFPKEAVIITICGKGGGRSAQGAVLLQQLGFAKANFLCGGTFGWFA